MMKVACVLTACLWCAGLALAAPASPAYASVGQDEPAQRSTIDSLGALSGARIRSSLLYTSSAEMDEPRRRSVPLALGLSAFVPGLGQAYNRDWVRSAVALAVEGGLLLGYVLWKGEGLDAEEAYKEYAHAFWDPGQYAGWLNDYVAYLEQTDGASFGVDPVGVPEKIDFSNPGSWTAQERQAVRSFFSEIRAVEDVVYHPETDAAFSHHLPYFGEQQYYELIGKYYQFAPGWVDYPDWRQGDEFTDAIDPERTGPGGTKPNVQGRFLDYAADHADANTLLRRASRVSAFLILNHVVAAFDAAVSAKLHNNRIDANVALGTDELRRPTLSASLFYNL